MVILPRFIGDIHAGIDFELDNILGIYNEERNAVMTKYFEMKQLDELGMIEEDGEGIIHKVSVMCGYHFYF